MVSSQATLASDWPTLRMLVTGNLAATQQDSSVSAWYQRETLSHRTNGIKLSSIFAEVSGCQTAIQVPWSPMPLLVLVTSSGVTVVTRDNNIVSVRARIC